MKKLISVLLVLVLAFSAFSATAFAEVETDCNGNCDTCPSIVVPGIGQSNVWTTDKNGEKVSCFPAIFDVEFIVSRAIVPILLTLITQHDVGLSAALSDIVIDSFEVNLCDNNGKNTGNIEVEKYPYSVAKCSDYEKDQIYNNVPLLDYAKQAGEDHLYYFAYNSFGNHVDVCNELYDFIQMVKEETGHDKVNIVPISMGGSVANGLLEYHPEVKNDLNKVVYIVPALDGSTIVGDLLAKDLTFLDAEFLFNGFLETLMDEETARLIEVVARIIPDNVLLKALNATVDTLVEEVAVNIPSLWALCPSSYYQELADKYLSTPEKAGLRKQTDMYYRAQMNSDKNIMELVESGVQVYNLVDYDVPLYCIGNTWNNGNADGVIHLDSTSMGAVSAKVGEKLPDGYKQVNTHCSNPEHNHISPDRVVDASAGLLPDTTFYFDAQNHESTARNDIIISLATTLLASDDITDVYSSADYPQFNGARDPRRIKNNLLPDAKAIDASTLNEADAAELAAAIKEAEDYINGTVCVAGQDDEIEARLRACLVAAGVYEETEEKEPSDFMTRLSLGINKIFGTNGFVEMPFVAISLAFRAIFDAIGKLISLPF